MASETSAIAVPLRQVDRTLVRNGLLVFCLFSIGHFFIDLYSSALSTFQPLLGDKLGLSLTQAGILGGLMVFSASVMQPVYGYLSDRFHSRLFTALAPAVAGIFISSLGLAPSYPVLLGMVFLGGPGIASLHPPAASNASCGNTQNHQPARPIFNSSGPLGRALG